MANLVPGFTWIPIDVSGRAARAKGRGLVGHVAVSGSTNLIPGPLSTRPADWHFYLPKSGAGVQYIDLDLQCWSNLNGNRSMAAFESQGGLGTAADVNAEPWTDSQIENAAQILAHMNETEGVPLQDMGNSLPGSRGFGVHRYGIDPWRVVGGEAWSSSRGKLCPGDAKVAQVPVIVSRANEIVHGSPTPPPTPPSTPARLAWNLPAGHYYGNVNGPAKSHGGYYASEKPFVANIWQWLIYHGCVSGHTDWRGVDVSAARWGSDMDVQMTEWHRRFYPNQQFPAQCWSDDYDRLARP